MDKFMNLLFSRDSVALLPHISLDWDALGSCLALQEALRNEGIRCDIVVDEPLSFDLSFWNSEVVLFKDRKEYDTLCLVDCSDLSRLGSRKDWYLSHKNTLCIDHHISSENIALYSIIDSTASSVGEMVYDCLICHNVSISKSMADYLFCAISTDTGSFQYSNVSKKTFEIASKLRECGADSAKCSHLLYQRKRLSDLKLCGAVQDSIKLYKEGKIAIAYLTEDDFIKCNASPSDTNGLASIPRTIDKVEVSAFLTQNKDSVKISFRSGENIDVAAIASTLGGGGHVRAAGATVKGELNSVMAKIISLLESAIDEWNNYSE